MSQQLLIIYQKLISTKPFYIGLIFGYLVLISACQSNFTSEELNQVRLYDGSKPTNRALNQFEQYVIHGETLFLKHCANCHQEDGKGLRQLYPPVFQSDYFKKNPLQTSCIIKNGLKGEIVVNGVLFNQPMDPHNHFTPIETAEVITYLLAKMNDSLVFVQQKDVESYICH